MSDSKLKLKEARMQGVPRKAEQRHWTEKESTDILGTRQQPCSPERDPLGPDTPTGKIQETQGVNPCSERNPPLCHPDGSVTAGQIEQPVGITTGPGTCGEIPLAHVHKVREVVLFTTANVRNHPSPDRGCGVCGLGVFTPQAEMLYSKGAAAIETLPRPTRRSW